MTFIYIVQTEEGEDVHYRYSPDIQGYMKDMGLMKSSGYNAIISFKISDRRFEEAIDICSQFMSKKISLRTLELKMCNLANK